MAQAIRDEIIEELLEGYSSPEDLLGEEGLFKELKKRLLERALGAELSELLDTRRGTRPGAAAATVATAIRARPCSAMTGRSRSRCRATVTAVSRPRSCRR